jgi:hypothetical protein
MTKGNNICFKYIKVPADNINDDDDDDNNNNNNNNNTLIYRVDFINCIQLGYIKCVCAVLSPILTC